jgi:hypothetical protein
MQPAYAANMWNEALNKRLGTEVVAFIYVTHFTVYGYLFNISLNSKPYCLLQFQIKISQPGCMMHHPETYKCSIKRKNCL